MAMHKQAIAAIILIVMLSTVGVFQHPALGYVLNPTGCRWVGSNPSIAYYLSNVTTPYATAMSQAENAWDATSSPGLFWKTTTHSQSMVDVYDDDYGANTYLAWVSGACDGNHLWIENLLLKWNQHYLDDDVAALKKAVGVHELGHVYGLWETTYTGCTNALNKGAIMRSGSWAWTTCGWNTPKIDDVAGVNAIY